jgi:hypothetical protein
MSGTASLEPYHLLPEKHGLVYSVFQMPLILIYLGYVICSV